MWIGDEGTTEVGGADQPHGDRARDALRDHALAGGGSRRHVHAVAVRDRQRENGGGLALAPKQTWAGGLSARHALGPGVARGGLRFYGIGDRPASDDGVLIAPGFTQVDLHLGYRHRWFDLALDIENLLDGKFRSAQFATISRLRTEPAVGAPVPPGFSCGPTAGSRPRPTAAPAAAASTAARTSTTRRPTR